MCYLHPLTAAARHSVEGGPLGWGEEGGEKGKGKEGQGVYVHDCIVMLSGLASRHDY